ncbi:MAG: hypothetical protein GQE15_41775 [Archangiaceae bacterium]|nr:hypothetical protein [Archangiaceae bacterium]
MNLLLVVLSLSFSSQLAAADAGAPDDMDAELKALLAQLDADEAATESAASKEWNRLLGQATRPNPDCALLVNAQTRAIFDQLELDDASLRKNADGWLAVARCAEKQKFFGFMFTLARRYAKANKEAPHAELIVRAALGYELNDIALEGITDLVNERPNDADVALTAAKVNCRLRKWQPCLELAKKAMSLAEKEPGTAISARAAKYQTRAELHLGELDQSELSALLMEVYSGDEDDLEALKQQLSSARLTGFIVEPTVVPHLALGTYHLAGRIKAVPAPVRVSVTNVGADQQVRVEAVLQGISEPASKTITLRKNKEALVELTPQLLRTVTPSSVRATRPTNLVLKVTSLKGKKPTLVFEDTIRIDVEPRDFLPMSRRVDAETVTDLNDFMAAWVTPNSKAIDAFLAKAKLRAPNRGFSGSRPTLPQAKALFDELKARGVSYVADPNVNSGIGFGQRTRLPAEVLASTNAQCLEGSLLFASLLEAIDLDPVIVLVPGHAFVGWRSNAADGSKAPDLYFLETTMIGTQTFDAAQASGQREYERERKRNKASLVRIAPLRAEGVTPQPFE